MYQASMYQAPFALTGATIDHVVVTAGTDVTMDYQREMEAMGLRD